jgi:hypothetical protein
MAEQRSKKEPGTPPSVSKGNVTGVLKVSRQSAGIAGQGHGLLEHYRVSADAGKAEHSLQVRGIEVNAGIVGKPSSGSEKCRYITAC